MSVCTDCNKINLKPVTSLQNEDQVCQTTVHETVCVQGNVTIKPKVDSGPITSFCMGNPIFGSCPGELKPTCQFTVSQNICIQIPLTFSATAKTVENGIVCGIPETGPCQGTTACTHTIGFFKNNLEITEELLNEAGGPIILGNNDDGLSFTVVTIDDAYNVLNLNTPCPPELEASSFYHQYLNLYAQLLAANLNVLALTADDVEICPFVIEAIEDANDFLATSPVEGKMGAPNFQEPLEEYNSGKAPGCPVHCEE